MTRRTRRFTWRGTTQKESGNALILAIILLFLLVALASAQFAVVQKNVRASSYFLAYSDLHKYAESGVEIGLHDLASGVSGSEGNIGTSDWTSLDDVGADGMPSTYDKGEMDGIPTVGEPHVYPAHMGLYLDTRLIVHVDSTTFPGILRVVSTASSPDGSATVDTFVRKTTGTIPKVASVFVDPDAALDLKGNNFTIDGNDHNPDGTPGPGPAVSGIGTLLGDPAGSNASMLLSQIPAKAYDQVLGDGGTPSVGESDGVDLNGLFESFKGMVTDTLTAGATYTDPDLGTPADTTVQVSYVGGDVHFSGKGQGAGVLLVDGSVTVSGQFTFYGLVIVRGDIRLVGGGAGVHTFGSVMVGQSITAIDPGGTDVTVTGNADLFYSSAVLAKLESMLQASYDVVYYDEK